MVTLTNVLDRVNNQLMDTEQTTQPQNHITVYFNANGSVTAISRGAIYLLGYNESELLSLRALDLFYQASDLFRFVLRFGQHEVMSKQVIPLRHKDGSLVNCTVTAIRSMSNISNEAATQESANGIPRAVSSLLSFLTHEHWENEKQYFNSLAVYLSNELNVDYVFIGYFKEDDLETVAPVTLYTSDMFQGNASHLLEGASFQNIISKDAYCFIGGIQEIFQHRQELVELEAESFAGITLRDGTGKAIGVLELVSQQYFQNAELIKTLLQIVSLRTAFELQNYLKHKSVETSPASSDSQEQKPKANRAIHELRDLISTLNTSIYMLKKKPHDVERIVKAMESQLAQVSILARKLREVSPELVNAEGKKTSKIDLNTIAANVINAQNDLIQKKHIELEFVPESNPAIILGNETQIERVIAKLLLNAVQQTLPQSYILVEIKELPSQVLLRVRDTGIGIDIQNTSDVFKHLYRTKSSQSPDKISRLDMSMIKDFVYQHYGQVEIDSNPEQGTEVRVYLPRWKQ